MCLFCLSWLVVLYMPKMYLILRDLTTIDIGCMHVYMEDIA